MKRMVLLCIALLVCSGAEARDKVGYDIDFPADSSPGASKIVPHQTTHELLRSQKSECSLISDGYFTIGTTTALMSGTLDDNCQITFGHPYAMTSYPFFTLDGVEQLPASCFHGLIQDVTADGDTLSLHASDLSTVEFDFDMKLLNNGETIRLIWTVWNFDSAAHAVGLGLVVDPALGKWGDGIAYVDGETVQEAVAMTSSIPGIIEIWERGTVPKGLGMALEFSDTVPDELHIGNWFDLSMNSGQAQTMIYDTAVKLQWDEVSVASGGSVTAVVDVHLKTPDFNEGIFLRTDLPSFLSVQENLLFPRPVVSVVDICNNGNGIMDNLRLEFEGDNINYNWKSSDTVTLLPRSKELRLIPVEVSDTITDHVVTLGVRVTRAGQAMDYLERNVLIPGIPRSETGLAVTIDSVFTADFPDVEVKFRALVEQTSQIVTKLRQENVFVIEDGSHVREFELRKDVEGGTNEADIVFVLDVTGSMSEEINSVKDNIIEFADSLTACGIDYRLAMVTFGDYIEDTYQFTTDPLTFKAHVSEQVANGGNDIPENSLDALVAAAEMPFRESANRTVIWITDASYHIEDFYTDYSIQGAVDKLLVNSVKVHCIGRINDKSQYYDPITMATGGDFFDINGNFRDILLGISRTEETGSYILSYTSEESAAESHTIEIKAYHAGLGGDASTVYDPSGGAGKQVAETGIACYPNPFNPAVHIGLNNPKLLGGEIDIYNILGQKVRSFSFNQGLSHVQVMWDARNDHGGTVSNGMYFVWARLVDQAGRTEYLPVAKIICAK